MNIVMAKCGGIMLVCRFGSNQYACELQYMYKINRFHYLDNKYDAISFQLGV